MGVTKMPRKSIKNETVDLSIETPTEEVKVEENNSVAADQVNIEKKPATKTTKKTSSKTKASNSSKAKTDVKIEEEVNLPGEIITIPEDTNEERIDDLIVPNVEEDEKPIEKEATKEKDEYSKYTR